MWCVCSLAAAAAFMLEHGEGIPKTPLIWVHALMALVLLFYFSVPGSDLKLDSHHSKIMSKLQSLKVHPDTLHYSKFEQANSVCCVFQADFDFSHIRAGYRQPSSLLYVGSTGVSVAKRHLNRMAVFRRLKKTEFVDAELSLRYWASHDNLFQFVIVPLQSFEDYSSAWIFEHELISQWQTQLNFPRATQYLKKTALGFRVSQKKRMSAFATYGLRLWRKLRKRLRGNCKPVVVAESRQTAWQMLYDLGSHTKASFNAAKIIRSHKRMTDAEIYALIKLSRSVENPTRAKIQRLLKSAVKYRETMHWPLTARPLGVLPLAHSSFNRDWERWLKQVIQDFKYLFPSFHVPRSNLREVPHQSIKKFLHNFRSWEETMWDPAFQLDSVKCSCSNFQQVLPDLCFVDGHVAAGLEQFDQWLGNCKSIARASAASTFFPAKASWKSQSLLLFDEWIKRNRLPQTLRPLFEAFCEAQWPLHLQALEETDRLTWNKVQQVKAKLHHMFVLYNEDHHPNHVMCYCPVLFMRSILNTWDDPSTFESLEGSPEHWKQEMLKCIPRHILKRYSWTINQQADLPVGTVFLKRKKSFQKGRTIISYSGSLCSKLLQLAAVVISIMTKTLYPDAPGMQSMPQLWQSLHQYWAKPTATPDCEWNDDLVGFFNAVPRRDIVTAVKQLTQDFLRQSSCRVLSVHIASRTGHQGKPRGRNTSQFKRCWVEDIPLIVEVSFSTGVFIAAGRCRLQKEGTCVGNQISPVLSGLPVLMAEQTFLKSLPAAVMSSMLFFAVCGQQTVVSTSSCVSRPTDSSLL